MGPRVTVAVAEQALSVRRATLLTLLVAALTAAPPAAPSSGGGPVPDVSAEGWRTEETEHLRVRFSPSALVTDPADYAKLHEDTLAGLLAFFGGPLSGPVELFVWAGDDEAKPVLGRPLAFAIPAARRVHTGPGHTPGHELTHVVVGDVLHPTVQRPLLQEGTAVAFDGSNRDLVAVAREAVRRSGARSVSVFSLWELKDADADVLYPVGGAFVQRLVREGGRERFLQLLREQSSERARALYGAELDTIVTAFEADLVKEPEADPLASLRAAAQIRMAKDRERYSKDDLRAIEALYQLGSMKTKEGREAYARLVRAYPESNRAGCAQLYLARTAEGPEREAMLTRAMTDHGDAWYGDGTQVGPYARALLAEHYAKVGRLDEARAFARAVAKTTPDAVAHDGRPLVAGLGELGLLDGP